LLRHKNSSLLYLTPIFPTLLPSLTLSLDAALGAFKGNHDNFFKALKLNFHSQAHVHSVETGHGRMERRTVSLCRDIESLPDAHQWVGLKTIIKVTSYRHILKGPHILINEPAVRY